MATTIAGDGRQGLTTLEVAVALAAARAGTAQYQNVAAAQADGSAVVLKPYRR